MFTFRCAIIYKIHIIPREWIAMFVVIMICQVLTIALITFDFWLNALYLSRSIFLRQITYKRWINAIVHYESQVILFCYTQAIPWLVAAISFDVR